MTLTELLETVHRVELRTNRLVNDTMVGTGSSHFRWRGVSFFSFPLTPALFLGERVNCCPSLGKYTTAFGSVVLRDNDASNGCPLSPRERVRVRGNTANLFAMNNRPSAIKIFP
jgi:hypothetical protein